VVLVVAVAQHRSGAASVSARVIRRPDSAAGARRPEEVARVAFRRSAVVEGVVVDLECSSRGRSSSVRHGAGATAVVDAQRFEPERWKRQQGR
jgi:hypothetical protein